MSTSEAEIRREITAKIKRDATMKREAKNEAERIKRYLIRRTPGPEPGGMAHADCVHEAPYATGDVRASIRLKRIREPFGLPAWQLGSDHPIINMLEYGTGPDKPGSRSSWGPNTPTPEFGMFAKTALHYGGTMP